MSAPRLALAAILSVAPAVAQVQLDRPMVLEGKPLTKADLDRKKVDDLLRDARAQFGVGVLQKRQDRLLEALKSLEKAATIDPESTEVRKALVPLYILFGREPDALAACQHALDRDPFDVDVAIPAARLLRSDGRPAEAAAILKKVAGGKPAQERPEQLLFLLSDLFDVLERIADHAGAADAQDRLVRAILEHREALLLEGRFSREDLTVNLARAYERLGKTAVTLKAYDRAATAFRSARDTLSKSDDSAVRDQAVRINWNIAEMAIAQSRWAEALEALETYLDHGPAESEPYEKLVVVLGKLGRERDVVPTLRKLATREQFNLNVQLLLARELAKNPRTRGQAEELYTKLLAKNIKPELYRGLFHLYRDDSRMEQVLETFDAAVKTAGVKDQTATAEEKESAKERGRVMLAVLRTDKELVKALLPEARIEVASNRTRQFDTWQLLAALAARTRQFEDAKVCFRQALVSTANSQQEYKVLGGLIGVMRMQHRSSEIVALCQQRLDRKDIDLGLALFLRENLAISLADLGKYDDASREIDWVVERVNDDHKVDAYRAKVHILAAAGKYADAERVALETLQKFTAPAQVRTMRYALSNAYSRNNDHEKSEAQLRLILETDPDAPLANNNLGYQLADRNVRLDEAEKLIRKAIAGDQSLRRDLEDESANAAYLDSLGWVLFRKGQFAEARTWLEKAAALPDGAVDPTVWDHLGDACVRADDVPAAKAAWRKAVELYDTPGHRDEPRKAAVEKKLKDLR